MPADKLQPRNRTARLVDARAAGNPVVTELESGVGNCFPGLEADVRNLDRRFFPYLAVDFIGSDIVVSEVFEEVVEGRLEGPLFVTDYPAAICPLTKRKTGNPAVAERFELFVHGMELANAYTELNDPLLQEALFQKQLAGIDRLCMLLLDQSNIRDVILFPLLRPQAT